MEEGRGGYVRGGQRKRVGEPGEAVKERAWPGWEKERLLFVGVGTEGARGNEWAWRGYEEGKAIGVGTKEYIGYSMCGNVYGENERV